MRVDTIDSDDAFDRLERDWNRIHDVDPEAHYFLSHGWLARLNRLRPETAITLAVRSDEPGSPYVCFLPLRRTSRQRIEAGGRAGWAQYVGFVCHPDHEQTAIPALADRVRELAWTRLSLKYFTAGERRGSLFLDAFDLPHLRVRHHSQMINQGTVDSLVCPFVDLPGDYESYLSASVSRNTRQKLRQAERRVAESPELRITDATDESFDADLEALLDLWLRNWRPTRGAEADRVAHRYREILRLSNDNGSLQLPVMRRGDVAIGALGNIVDHRRGHLFMIVAGRDDSAPEKFIGKALHGHSIRWAIDNDVTRYDFCHGNEHYKYLYGASDRRISYISISRQRSTQEKPAMNPDLPLDATIQDRVGRADPSVIVRDLGDDVALFHPRRKTSITLNPAGFWLWEQCDGRASVDDLVGSFAREVGLPVDDVDASARDVLETVIREGFVRREAYDRLPARAGRPYVLTTTRWCAVQRYVMLGVGVVVRCNDVQVASTVFPLFSSFATSDVHEPRDVVISVVRHRRDDEDEDVFDVIRFDPSVDRARFDVAHGTAEDAVMETLVAANSAAVNRNSYFTVHAGGVAARDGVVMLPAGRNVGKSTLVAACLAAGLEYVSDEAVALRWADDDTVVPYPKPFWLRAWSREQLGIPDDHESVQWLPDTYRDAILDARPLGRVVADDQRLVPTDVVKPVVTTGAARLEPMSNGDVAAVVMDNAFDKYQSSRQMFEYTVRLARRVRGWQLSYSDPVEAAALLADRFGVPAG